MKATHYIIAVLLCIFSIGTGFASLHANPEPVVRTIQEASPTIIELLQNGESYSIEITSIGCFNGSQQTLVVFKEADLFTVHFQENSKVLSEIEVKALIRFELQLRALNIGGCTTIDTYILRYGAEKFQTSDGTCLWNGGKKLLKQLGYA